MPERLTIKKVAEAVEELAKELGKINNRLDNVEKVLKDHVQEPDAHHPGFIVSKD